MSAPGRNDLDDIIRRMEEVFRTGVPAEFDFWGVRKNGQPFPKDVIVNKGRYFGREVLIATARDTSLQKQAEADRERLQAELNQAQKMESIGRLAGGVAHDFNNMLGVILGHAELALETVDRSLPVFSDLQEIDKAAQRSAELTRRLLAYARKQTVAPRVLQLNETVEGMLSMLRRLIGENMELVWQPGRELWPVRIDPVQIDQILANLCVNARDAIRGIGRVTITTDDVMLNACDCVGRKGVRPGQYVSLTVSDNGCGMDEGVMEHLFEPYFTTKGLGKGTGLGLAMVYGIVHQNDGFIQVRSEPGQGTSIQILLPRHVGVDLSARTQKISPSQLPGRQTLLVVEDEPAILNLARNALERQGYKVLATTSPGEALRLAETHAGDIHLLLTDVIMPEMNGRDLARRLLSLHPELKRLFMSGYTADVIAHHGVLEPDVHFIQKPFSNTVLVAKVREVLAEGG
ncbi:MAG: ATP-binding protein [Kiritimatiellia bacterium]